MVHGGGVIGNSGMPCDHDGVRHQAGVRLRHQGRVALEEAALVFRQTADAVDMRFHLLPRPGVKRGLWKAYLLPLRMLALQVLGVLVSLQRSLEGIFSGRRAR